MLTGGDANPHRIERVPRRSVVGRVTAVWSGPGPGALRIDDRGFRLRGVLLARMRPLRSLSAKIRGYAALMAADVGGDASGRPFAALVAATGEFEQGRHAAGVARLHSIAPSNATDIARRHRAGGLIGGWLEDAARSGVSVPAELNEPFRRLRWINALAGRPDRELRARRA